MGRTGYVMEPRLGIYLSKVCFCAYLSVCAQVCTYLSVSQRNIGVLRVSWGADSRIMDGTFTMQIPGPHPWQTPSRAPGDKVHESSFLAILIFNFLIEVTQQLICILNFEPPHFSPAESLVVWELYSGQILWAV